MGIFGDAVPAIVEVDRGDSVGGGGDFSAAGIEEVLLEVGACGVFDFYEAVFGVPDEGAEGGGRYRQRIGSGVAIEVINRRDACAPLLDGGVLVQRVAGVVVAGWQGQAVVGFLAIADGVVLVGTVTGVYAAIRAGDLA